MSDPCGKCAMMVTCLAREMAVIHTVCAYCRMPMGIPIDEGWDPILGFDGGFFVGIRRMPHCRRAAAFRKGKKAPRGLCTECAADIGKTRERKERWANKLG